jgi:hypothetical protein
LLWNIHVGVRHVLEAGMIRSYHELVGQLAAHGMIRRTSPEAEMVAVTKEDAEVILRWDDPGLLLHVTQAIPRRIPSERWTAVACTITGLNHELTVPGFGLDPESRMAYYRLVVPRHLDGAIAWEEVLRVLRICVRTTRQYAATILGPAIDVSTTAIR